VTDNSAVVAPDPGLSLLLETLRGRFIFFGRADRRPIEPVALCREVGEFSEAHRFCLYQRLYVLSVAVGTSRTEAKLVVRAEFALDVAHRTVNGAQLAETLVEVGAIFHSAVARRSLVPVYALLALEAVTLQLKVAADRHSVLFIHVKVLALLAALALLLQPVDTDDLFVLGLVSFQIVRLV